MYYDVLRRDTTYYNVLQRTTMYYDVLQRTTTYYNVLRRTTETAWRRRHTASSRAGLQAQRAHVLGTAGTPPALTYFFDLPLRLLLQITNSSAGTDLTHGGVPETSSHCIDATTST